MVMLLFDVVSVSVTDYEYFAPYARLGFNLSLEKKIDI